MTKFLTTGPDNEDSSPLRMNIDDINQINNNYSPSQGGMDESVDQIDIPGFSRNKNDDSINIGNNSNQDSDSDDDDEDIERINKSDNS